MFSNLVAFASLTVGVGLVFDLILSIYHYRPDIVDYGNRVNGTPSDKLQNTYDFIVVGGGSAGAVVASRLSEDPRIQVLLIEAGAEDTVFSDIPSFWSSQMGSTVDWGFKTVKSNKSCLSTTGVCPVPRGKVLGGSSVINAMMYVRGNRRDYDQWEAFGNIGWKFVDVLQYFKKSEKMEIDRLKTSKYHGTDGYLNVAYLRSASVLRNFFFSAGKEMNILNKENDCNGQSQFGISHTQVNVREGFRCSTNKAFLRVASHRTNLHISLNSFVEKIDINPITKRAESVRFSCNGQKFKIRTRKEIVLSAGAVQSPQLLLLSGIGSAVQLRQFNISVINDLPGVGENLQDHIGFVSLFLFDNSTEPLSYISKDILTPETIRQLVHENRGSLFSAPSSETVAFINTKFQNKSLDWPDIQCLLSSQTDLVGVIEKNGLNRNGFLTFPYILRPYSRGKVYLKSRDPYEPPLIDTNYYSDERDLKVVIEGVKFGLRLSKTNAMSNINAQVSTPPMPDCSQFREWSDDWIGCAARYSTQSIFHLAGTCKMGPTSDGMAVVNAQLKVHGVQGLRVIDASIMPTIVSGNTNGPTIMIAEKGADMIKKEHPLKGGWQNKSSKNQKLN